MQSNETIIKNCFICERSLEIFVTIQSEVSKYTNTPILNILDQLIGDNNDWPPSLLNDGDGFIPNLCSQCVERINNYDLACETIKRVGDELRAILTKALDNVKAKIPYDEYSNEESYKIEYPTEYETEINISIESYYGNEEESSNHRSSPEVDISLHEKSHGDCKTTKVPEIINGKSNDNNLIDVEDPKKCNQSVKPKYKCRNENCGAEFSKRPEYSLHRKQTGHLTEFKCKVCGKIYRSRVPYADHLAVHIGGAMYECDICGTKFTQKCSLKRHKFIHDGVKKFQCDLCGKQFIHRSSLLTHIYYHNKIGGRKCDVCGLTVPPNTSLNTHMMTHTDVKPHGCTTCGKKFNKPGNLRSHIMKIHKGINTVTAKPCTFCSRTFSSNVKLNEHLITIHEIELPDSVLEIRKRFRRGKTASTS